MPSCKVDLTRYHPKPCLQYHIHRCLGPCVEGLTTDDAYAGAVKNVKLFLEGRHADLAAGLRERMQQASDETRFEEAASLRDLLSTVEEMEERQKMAAVKGDDIDIFAAYAEPPLVALNLFHLRNGQIVDRREFFWEDQHEFDEPQFFSALIKQIYIDQQHIPSIIHVPVDFEDREALEELLSEKRGRKVEIHTPQRGQKKAMLNLVETNAKHSFDQRFRVMKPSSRAIQEALAGRAGTARRAQAHRMLRHLAHPGHRQSGQHGGVGRRAHEEGGLPQVHHPHGDRQRRFRQHARGGDAPLLAAAAGEPAACPAWC